MKPERPANRLIIFVKAPRPGLVKTRLAAIVGDKTAAETYEVLVESLLANLRELSAVELKFAPPEARDEIDPWMQPGWTATPQYGGDLTHRLVGAFDDAFQEHARRVVIIGSDCPDVTQKDIAEAFARLEDHDLVLGPATDGGYWLVGLRRPCSALFAGISWSTDTVLTETLAIAAREGLSTAKLRELSDIDTVADLLRFHEQQRHAGKPA